MGDANMGSPENLSGGKDANIHAAISSQRLPASGTRSVPAELKPAPDKKSSHKLRDIALVGLALATVETTGAIIAEQVNEKPASIQTIPEDLVWPWDLGKSTVEDIQRILGIGEAPLTFDNKAGKAKFGENNIARITPQEAQAKNLLEPTVTVNNKGDLVVTTILPGIFPSAISTAEVNSEHSGTSQVPLAEQSFPTPKDFRLTIPKNAYYAALQGNSKLLNQDPNLVYMVNVFYYDARTNKSIVLVYENNKGWVPEDGQKIIDTTTYNKSYEPSLGGKVTDLPRGDGISSVTKPVATDGQGMHILAFAYDGPNWEGTPIPVVLESLVNPDQKLTILSEGSLDSGNGVVGPF